MRTLNGKELHNYYKNYNIDIIEIDGEAYALDKDTWNGESGQAWQLDDDYNVINECSIMSKIKQVDKETLSKEAQEALAEDGDFYEDDNRNYYFNEDGTVFQSYYEIY